MTAESGLIVSSMEAHQFMEYNEQIEMIRAPVCAKRLRNDSHFPQLA